MVKVLSIKSQVDGLDVLDNYINFVQGFATSKFDEEFQSFLQDKCIKTIKQQTDILLNFSGKTVEGYKNNNKIRKYDKGFIIYNDYKIDTTTDGYDGSFSIALAFEYGTGVVGQESAIPNAWQYNVNPKHIDGWTYFKNEAFHFTKGLRGAEIYRTSAAVIQRKLPDWVKEYFNRKR